MEVISTLLIAVALAMDAFSVSMTKGFTQKTITNRQILIYAIFFGGFQAIMPLIGYVAGSTITQFVSFVAPWIAFILLLLIGTNMIRESLSGDEEDVADHFDMKEVVLLAIATSIDALAVGITYAILKSEIIIPAIIIGIVAFIFTLIGIYLGKKLGNYFGDKFEIVGGIILILIGIKTLLGY